MVLPENSHMKQMALRSRTLKMWVCFWRLYQIECAAKVRLIGLPKKRIRATTGKWSDLQAMDSIARQE